MGKEGRQGTSPKHQTLGRQETKGKKSLRAINKETSECTPRHHATVSPRHCVTMANGSPQAVFQWQPCLFSPRWIEMISPMSHCSVERTISREKSQKVLLILDNGMVTEVTEVPLTPHTHSLYALERPPGHR